MIDLNTLISQALAAAVQQATAPLLERIATLESQSAVLLNRVTALEKHPAMLDEHGGLLEYLDNQEWFWEKIREFTGNVVEQAIENHTDCWDHNDFVTEDKLDDYVKTDNFRDEIEDVINNATIRLNF